MLIKKVLITLAALCIASTGYAAQKTVYVGTTSDKKSLDTNFGNIQDNFTEIYGNVNQSVKTTSNPAFNSVNLSSGNVAANNIQVVKQWITGLSYTADATAVVNNGMIYICKTTHTAGTFATDLAANKWTLWGSQVASDIAFTPNGSISSTTVQAAIQEVRDEAGSGSLPSATEGQILQANSSGTYVSTSSFAGLINDSGTATDDLKSASWIISALSGKQATLGSNAYHPYTSALAGISGNSKYWGTNGSGTVGVYDLPSSGATSISGISDWPSGLTATELGYVDGATSNLQTQITNITAGSMPHVSSGDPSTSGSWNFNTTDKKIRTRLSTGDLYVTGAMTLETAADTTPNSFTFTDETGIAINTAKVSDTKTLAGTSWPAAISVTGDTGYGYKKNGSACTATSGTISTGDTFNACVTSSGSNSTATNATVTIGGVSDEYRVTTVAGVANLIGAPGSTETFEASAGNFITGQFAETDPQSIINTYSTVQYKNGTHSAYFGFTGSEAGRNYLRADIGGTDTNFTLSYWLRVGSLPAWNNELIFIMSQNATIPYNVADSALLTMIADQDGGTNFKIRLYDSIGGSSTLGSNNYAVGTWIRLKYTFISGASSNLKIYNSSDSLQETITITAPTRALQYFYWGEITSIQQVYIRSFYIDDVQYDSTNQ